MKNSMRRVDFIHSITRYFMMRQEPNEQYLLVCGGGAEHVVLLASQLERFRLALGGKRTQLAVLIREDAMAAAFLFDGRAEVISIDFERFSTQPNYRANTMTGLLEGNFKGVVSLDYVRHPWVDEAMIRACRRPAMAMKPAPISDPTLSAALESNASLYKTQFDSGAPGLHIAERWADFADYLSAAESRTPVDLQLDEALLAPAAVLDKPMVFLQPFCRDGARRPSAEFFAALIDAVPVDHDVVMPCTDDLLTANPDLQVLASHNRVSTKNIGLSTALPLMRAAKLVIAAESAPMHIALLGGMPTLALASAAYWGDTLPYPGENGAHAHVLQHDIACKGCRGDCAEPLRDGRTACIAMVDQDAAVSIVRDTLSA